jgi:hypothetical protein
LKQFRPGRGARLARDARPNQVQPVFFFFKTSGATPVLLWENSCLSPLVRKTAEDVAEVDLNERRFGET